MPRGVCQCHADFRGACGRRESSKMWTAIASSISPAASVCLNVGHRSPRVVAAIREQLEAFMHTCFSVAPYEGYIALAEKLNSLAPWRFREENNSAE